MTNSADRNAARSGRPWVALRTLLSGSIDPYRKVPRLLFVDAMGAAVVSAAIVVLGLVLGSPRPFVAFLYLWAMGLTVLSVAQGALAYQLRRRIKQPSGGWTVRVCGKPAALIGDADLAWIEMEILCDTRARTRWWMAWFVFAMQLLSALGWMLPTLLFWLAVGLIFADPESFDTLRSLSAQEWRSVVKPLELIGLTLAPVLIWLALAFARKKLAVPTTLLLDDEVRWRVAATLGLRSDSRIGLEPHTSAQGANELPRIEILPRQEAA
ncbi:hypothetical protein [Ideonella sp. YS5]|uniref:hypothetical protein n=1 Tax=Ideonella sp. YS5 TaxID=3453714 RepID=UPI003EEEED84